MFVSGKALLRRRTGDPGPSESNAARGEKAVKDAFKRVFRHALNKEAYFFPVCAKQMFDEEVGYLI
ncbi:MAG: hypothetical protein K0R57_2320 [Paenibacillaceae bacterium]|jgi:hypothetical protein|nr:hypothetical protein [Paenibacillaceae bacterium]